MADSDVSTPTDALGCNQSLVVETDAVCALQALLLWIGQVHYRLSALLGLCDYDVEGRSGWNLC